MTPAATPPGSAGVVHVRGLRAGRFRASTYARREDGAVVRVQATGSSPTAARRALVDRVALRVRVWDSATLSVSATVETAVRAWLAWLEVQGELRPQSIDSYRGTARLHVIPALGKLRLQELRTTALEGALRTMTPGTATEAKKVLSGVLHHARRLGVMTSDPWQIGPVGTPSPAIRYFDSGDSVLLGAGGVVCSG